MLVYKKMLNIDGNVINFKYKIITGELSCKDRENNCLFKSFLWFPYKKFNLEMLGKKYVLRTMLFPINKISLHQDELVICSDLFPKLKRYTLISFSLSTIKRISILLALMFS
jgi:hypothetical protein